MNNLELFAVFALIGSATSSRAQSNDDPIFAARGDTGIIEFVIENDPESDGPLEGVRVFLEPNQSFVVESSSTATAAIGPGQNKVFSINYRITETATDFSTVIHTTMSTMGVDPDPSVFDTNVVFTTKPVRFSLDRLG